MLVLKEVLNEIGFAAENGNANLDWTAESAAERELLVTELVQRGYEIEFGSGLAFMVKWGPPKV